jgi:hypothetical protein
VYASSVHNNLDTGINVGILSNNPIYQNMVSFVVRLSIRKFPSKLMFFIMWEHGAFDNAIFGYAKIYCSNSIIVTNFM